MAQLELPVEGMTCEHCVRTVTAALAAVPGVRHAKVDLAGHTATVDVDSSRVSRDQLSAAVRQAGFNVPVDNDGIQPTSDPLLVAQRTVLDVQGMHCASCVGRVETALQKVPGVRTARVNLATEQAAVEFDPHQATLDALTQAVSDAGYRASPSKKPALSGDDLRHRSERELLFWQRRTMVGLVLLVPLLAVHWAGHSWSHSLWWQFLLATPIQLYLGGPMFLGAWQRLRHGSTNMDTLVALGTGAAYAAGMAELAVGSHAMSMYFADAGMILTFITLGKYLEARAKGRASAAIRKLLDLTPPEANVLRGHETVRVPVADVALGATIVVRPGEKVPLDAEILSGNSSVDEAWLTGESMPVEKSVGQTILAGTINGSGSLTAQVTHTAGQTALAQIIELVRRAQESKTEIQRLADRVVSWFVPGVLAVAAVTFIAWMVFAQSWTSGLASAVAVLVVACPCALGLATPTAILAASGRGAELGILVKEAHSLEVAGRLTTVVLDKTGTVTRGKPQIVELLPEPGITSNELLATAAAAERLSQHPLAATIVTAAKNVGASSPQGNSISAADLEVVPGQGIRATTAAGAILVGNEKLLASHGIDCQALTTTLASLRGQGQTPLLVARADKLLGVITVADVVAEHSREAIERLVQLGLQVRLLSGDHRATVAAMAREVGIQQFDAEVLPQDKQAVVAELRRAGQIVAMVGDGINDAPALAAADLGIAIGSGSDIAIEAADIVLVQSDLRGVARTVVLARATLRTIRQNLVWAFLYNLLLIPLAAGLLKPWTGWQLPPAAAAAAMALSSVSVVVNSLRLQRRKLE